MPQLVQERWICTGSVSPVPVPLSTACSHHPAVVCHGRSAWLSQPHGTAWLRGEVITEQGAEQSEAGAM